MKHINANVRKRQGVPRLVNPKIIKKEVGRKKGRERLPSLSRPLLLNTPNTSKIDVPWIENYPAIDVSIIIPLFRSKEVIKEQIDLWDFTEDGLSKEIVYVDDCCPQHSFAQIINLWQTKPKKPVCQILVNDKNSGFGTACNIGANAALGKYLIFLNADCTVTKDWVKPMIDVLMNNQKIGIVGNLHFRGKNIDSAGSEWLTSAGEFLHIGRHILNGHRLDKPYTIQDAPPYIFKAGEREMVTGACFAMPAELFKKLNGFDPGYVVGYWEDADLNMRVRLNGYKVHYTPDSKIYHRGGHSQGGRYHKENKAYFYKKWIGNRLMAVINMPTTIDKSRMVVYTAGSFREDQITSDLDFVALDAENAPKYKILSHKTFPQKEFSLWIDNNIQVKAPVDKIVEYYMRDGTDLLIHQHDAESKILLRRHSKTVEKFNELWWEETQKKSRSELSVIAKKAGLKFKYFPLPFKDLNSPFFRECK